MLGTRRENWKDHINLYIYIQIKHVFDQLFKIYNYLKKCIRGRSNIKIEYLFFKFEEFIFEKKLFK